MTKPKSGLKSVPKLGTFYHFTSPDHLPLILEAGFLKRVESNVGSPYHEHRPYGEHVGPDVVWLLDVPEIEHDHGLANPFHDKGAIRFTVKCKAVRWLSWTEMRRADKRWSRALVQRGGGYDAACRWYVALAQVPQSSWLAIDNVRTGESIELPAKG